MGNFVAALNEYSDVILCAAYLCYPSGMCNILWNTLCTRTTGMNKQTTFHRWLDDTFKAPNSQIHTSY